MTGNMRSVSHFLGDRSGSMTVEFVVLVPLLLAALVFSFEFGRALWAYDVMTRDVRAAVRYLSRTSAAPAVPNCPAATQTEAENMAKRGLPGGTAADDHFPWKDSAPTFGCSTTAFSSAQFSQDGSVITMTANVPITLSFLEFLDTVAGSDLDRDMDYGYTLSVSDQARWIGN